MGNRSISDRSDDQEVLPTTTFRTILPTSAQLLGLLTRLHLKCARPQIKVPFAMIVVSTTSRLIFAYGE